MRDTKLRSPLGKVRGNGKCKVLERRARKGRAGLWVERPSVENGAERLRDVFARCLATVL